MISNSIKVFLSTLFAVVLFSSCTHFYYLPNSPNTPVLQKKGDGHVSANIAQSLQTGGFELQSAYALGNHFGAMVNLYGVTRGDNTSTNSGGVTDTETTSAYFAEIGAGYFTKLNTDKNKAIFETYAGIGTGTVKNDYYSFSNSKVGVTRLFVQPSIGLTNEKENFTFAFATRISHVSLKVKSVNVNSNTYLEDLKQLADVENNGNRIYFEPSALVRFGGKNIKMQVKFSNSNVLQRKLYRTQSGLVSVGVMYAF